MLPRHLPIMIFIYFKTSQQEYKCRHTCSSTAILRHPKHYTVELTCFSHKKGNSTRPQEESLIVDPSHTPNSAVSPPGRHKCFYITQSYRQLCQCKHLSWFSSETSLLPTKLFTYLIIQVPITLRTILKILDTYSILRSSNPHCSTQVSRQLPQITHLLDCDIVTITKGNCSLKE